MEQILRRSITTNLVSLKKNNLDMKCKIIINQVASNFVKNVLNL